MQLGIVRQIQFSLRSFHLFIHLYHFYLTPAVDQCTEQGAGDIRSLPTVSSFEEEREVIKQPEHIGQTDKRSNGRTPQINIPSRCICNWRLGVPGVPGFLWVSGGQPGDE